MAVGVVDGLEVVDVDEGDRQRPLVAAGTLDLGEQFAQQRLAVGDARQSVHRGLVVGIREGHADRVDRAGESAVHAVAASRDGHRVVARREPLHRLDQAAQLDLRMHVQDRRGHGHAGDRRGHGGHDQPGLAVHEGPGELRHQQEQRPDRERCREREDAKKANHPPQRRREAVSAGTGRRY